MSNATEPGAEAKSSDLPDEPGLPAFRTMGRGYKFVFARLPAFIRMGWRPFLYSLGFAIASQVAPKLLNMPKAALGIEIALLMLAACFVLHFATLCHQYAYRELRPDDPFIQSVAPREGSSLAYVRMFLIGIVILLSPIAAVFALFYFTDLGEAAVWPLGIIAITASYYLGARMSVLFAQTALIGQLPPRWTWNVSRGLVWKLVLIVTFAPWPFNVALKFLGGFSERLDVFWSLPIFGFMWCLAFLAVAVLTTILSDAFWHCLQRNFEMITEQAKRSGAI